MQPAFRELHDHVDANAYLDEASVPFGTDPGAVEDGCGSVNAVSAEVSKRLSKGAHLTEYKVMDTDGITVSPVRAATSDEAVDKVKQDGYDVLDVMDDTIVIGPGA